MKNTILNVWPADETVTLTVFENENGEKNRPAIIVLPGGAYIAPAPNEADPVAERFAQMGYLGCALRCSTMYRNFEAQNGTPNPHTVFPEPLQELGAAIALLRGNAEQYGIDPNKIAVMGFSAGGHLAANYGNYWYTQTVCEALGLPAEQLRPNATVLCYAATELTNVKAGAMLHAAFGVREQYEQEDIDRYNARFGVNRNTPPTFLWHTVDDAMVSVQQTYHMAQALDEEHVPYELHVFSSGAHASALSQGMPAQSWPALADSFLKRNF